MHAVVPEAPVVSLDSATAEADCFSITVLSTGGTISKTYDEQTAGLRNVGSMAVRIIQSLRLPGTKVKFRTVLDKDSLDITDADRAAMIRSISLSASRNDAVVVLHGTDTMTLTAEALLAELPAPKVPVVFTGAMTPYVIDGSDARQNVTEALLACRLLDPGVYVVVHGRALRCPGVRKDYDTMTFVRHPS